MQVATATPTGTGGTILAGKYLLTKIEGYTGNGLGALDLKQTLVFCANAAVFVSENTKKPTPAHKNFTVAPSGTAINITTTCSTEVPDTNIPYDSYTATSSSVTFYSTAFKFSVTYTK